MANKIWSAMLTVLLLVILIQMVRYSFYFKEHGRRFSPSFAYDIFSSNRSGSSTTTTSQESGQSVSTARHVTSGGGATGGGVVKRAPHQPLLTLFSTFKNASDRVYIQRNTILNWATFGQGRVKTVMFSLSDSGYLEDIARDNGWSVHRTPRVNKNGTPFLKDMYNFTMQHYNSTFYAFVNGDIMFEESLVDTLRAVKRKADKLNITLVVGRRTDFKVNYTDPTPLYSQAYVTQMGRKGLVFRIDAEDYFIMSKDFPWNTLKDVVIGRPGYDNYIVGRSIMDKLSVVDATKTLLALHQNAKVYPFAGTRNVDGQFNIKAIGRFNYNKGLTTACPFESIKDFSGEVFIRKRK